MFMKSLESQPVKPRDSVSVAKVKKEISIFINGQLLFRKYLLFEKENIFKSEKNLEYLKIKVTKHFYCCSRKYIVILVRKLTSVT